MSIAAKQYGLGYGCGCVKSGEILQKEVCMEKQLSLSAVWKSEMKSRDSEQADEVLDGHWCSQLTAVHRNMVGCSDEGSLLATAHT